MTTRSPLPPAPHRHRRRALIVGLAVAAAAALLAWLATPPPAAPDGSTAAQTPFPWARTPQPDHPEAPPPAQAATASAPPAVTPPVPVAAAAAMTQAEQRTGAVFRTDAQGRLQLDAGTRHRVEALLALHDGEALQARTEAELAPLPAPAAARARELLAQMQAYQAAQFTNFPPDQAPLVPEEGLAQLAALQGLRASHFGAEAAQQLFGEDDAVTRRLLELMRDERSAMLSMAQKATRAQARYDIERGAVKP